MDFRSFDGKRLYLNEWMDAEKPRGVVQIVHGMVEHGARYEAFARFLNHNGYLVVADDHRGHGRTDGDTLGYSRGDMFGDTVRDEAEITAFYREKYPQLKHYIFGFSYGSFITQSYISKYGDRVDGAVIAGSNYKKDFEVYLGSLVAHLGREKKPAKFIENLSFGAYAKRFDDGEWISADPENNGAYRADPLCGFTCSNRFYRDLFKGLKSLYTKKYIAGLNLDLPLLLAAGEDDAVGDMGKGMKKLYDFYREKAGMKNVELVLFEDSRHEFLNERRGREIKWNAVLDFLNRH